MLAELTHYPDGVVLWRPADTEVWATAADGNSELIGGFSATPFPASIRAENRWIDRRGA